jgi:hypothetical protein
MSITQGSPLPDITTTTTQAKTAPSYYTDYLSGLSQAGQTALSRTPGQMIAGLDPLQMRAYAELPEAAAAYQPGLSAAEQTAASAATGVSPERLASFMNPYTQNVVEEMGRLSEQNIQRNILPSLRMGMVGTGQLGSQRYAGALGQGLAEASKTLTGQQYGALSEGYKTALDAAFKEAGLERETAQTQANIAKLAQDLGLGEVGALEKAGTTRQAYEQSLLDQPLKTASQVQALLRGFDIPTSETKTVTGPGQAGQYAKSGLENISGLLSLLGAASTGTAATRAAGLFENILKALGPSVTNQVDWASILANQGVQNAGGEASGAVQTESGTGSV